MAKSLRRHIVQHFAKLATQAGFQLYTEIAPCLSRKDIAFSRMSESGHGAAFIVLLFDHRGRPWISAEIGWSSDQQFPHVTMRPSGEASVERKEFKESDFLTRLSTLWGEPDAWWKIETEADIPKVIGDVMGRLETYGFPYLAEKESTTTCDGPN
jgi:hypothetical protein